MAAEKEGSGCRSCLISISVAFVLVIVAFKLSFKDSDAYMRDYMVLEMRRYEVALKAFRNDCGRYPTTREGLISLLERPKGVREWNGPYTERISFDSYERDYVYENLGPKGIRLASYGRDGLPGGWSYDRDVEHRF